MEWVCGRGCGWWDKDTNSDWLEGTTKLLSATLLNGFEEHLRPCVLYCSRLVKHRQTNTLLRTSFDCKTMFVFQKKTLSVINNDLCEMNLINTDESFKVHFAHISFLIFKLRRISLRVQGKLSINIRYIILYTLPDSSMLIVKITLGHKTSL